MAFDTMGNDVMNNNRRNKNFLILNLTVSAGNTNLYLGFRYQHHSTGSKFKGTPLLLAFQLYFLQAVVCL